MYHLRVRTENEAQEEEKKRAKRKKGSRLQKAEDNVLRGNS